ncbi:glycosyl transferase, partial [Micromonospora sp. NPDC000207]
IRPAWTVRRWGFGPGGGPGGGFPGIGERPAGAFGARSGDGPTDGDGDDGRVGGDWRPRGDGPPRGDGSPPGDGPPRGDGSPPGGGPGPGGGRPRGGAGGLLDAREPSEELRTLLTVDADSYTWVAATVGSNNASGYQLATGRPVMAVGGFNGSDPSPTLARFQQYVAEGRIHYFLGGGGFNAIGGSDVSGDIAGWVAANFTAETVDGVTLYDLTGTREG